MIDDELTLATAYVDTRRWRQALEVLRPVISRSPEDPYALCLIAHCHLGLQDPSRALAAANAAAAAAPMDPWAARLQSAALRAARRWREARAAADRAIGLAPNSLDTHLERAAVDAASGRPTRAGIAAAHQAVRLGPDVPAAHVASGNVWLVRRRPKQARTAFTEALRLDPTNVAAQHGLALIAQQFGSQLEAARLLIGIIRLDPANQQYAKQLRDVLTVSFVFPGLAGVLITLLAIPNGVTTVPTNHLLIAMALCVAAQVIAFALLRRAVGPALIPLLMSPPPEDRRRLWMLRVAFLAYLICDLALLLGALVTTISVTMGHLAMVATLVAMLLVVFSIARLRRS